MIDDAKVINWINEFGRIVRYNNAAAVCLSNNDLFLFVNDKLKDDEVISKQIFNKLIAIDTDNEQDQKLKSMAESLQNTLQLCKIQQHLDIYDKMNKPKYKFWQREFKILERRYKEQWSEHVEDNTIKDQTLNITFVEDKGDE